MDSRPEQIRPTPLSVALVSLAVAAAVAALVALPIVGGLAGLCVAVFVLGVTTGAALRRQTGRQTAVSEAAVAETALPEVAACEYPPPPVEPERFETLPGWSKPPAQASIGPFDIASHAEFPEGAGGDWWIIRQLAHGGVLLVIGDVTGHGLSAALVAAQARGAVAALEEGARGPITPTRVLGAVHRVVRAVGEGKLFTTCFAMVLDPASGVVDYANASHCFPYVLSQGKEKNDLDIIVARGNPLGDEEQCIAAGRRVLRPGDVFVLHTDGLADGLAASAGRCGNAQLRNVLRKQGSDNDRPGPLSIRDALRARLRSGGVASLGPDADDLTLIVCQFATHRIVESPETTSRCRVVETAPGKFAVLEERVEKAHQDPVVVHAQQDEAEQGELAAEDVELAEGSESSSGVALLEEDIELDDLEFVEDIELAG